MYAHVANTRQQPRPEVFPCKLLSHVYSSPCMTDMDSREHEMTTAAAGPRGLATVEKAAQFLDVSEKTIRRMVAEGEITSTTIRGMVRIPWTVLKGMAAPDRR